MDKEVVVYIHNRILLSHKKEHIWISSNGADEPRTFTLQDEVSQKEYHILMHIWASQVVLAVKNPPANCKKYRQVCFLGQEDSLEKGMATQFNILAWRIPGTEEPNGLESIGSQRVGHDWSNLAHMESRKMGLMKLSAGQQWRHRHREQTCRYGGEVGQIERVALKHTHFHM